MDYLYKLSQMIHVLKTQNYNSELFKNLDVSVCFPDDLKMPEAGCNCLHMAALGSNMELMKKLLDRGTDLVKQGVHGNQTPLHIAIKKNLYNQTKRADRLMGKLGKHPIVDLLLSAQVKRNITANPKCIKGVSHLHIACMVDHIEAVSLFLKAGEPVNQTVGTDDVCFPGWTPLHFTVRYSAVSSTRLLIGYGADIHVKDANGNSPLHYLINRFLDVMDHINMARRALVTPFIEEMNRLEDISCCIVTTYKVNKVVFVDDTGISTFHIACTIRDPLLIKNLLGEDIDINKPMSNKSKSWPGWTLLHFAACCNLGTFEQLLENGADITIKNAKGETPLDLCMARYPPGMVHPVLLAKKEFREIILLDQSTNLLKLLFNMDDCTDFNKYLQDLPNVNAVVPLDSPIWPGYSILHLAISMQDRYKDPTKYFSRLADQEIISEKYTCTESEEKNYWKRIVVCLVRNCSLTIKNDDGLTPVHLAFKMLKFNVVDKLLNSCRTNEYNSDDLSFLHMACAIGKKNFVEKFPNDINARVKNNFQWRDKQDCLYEVHAKSTSLHIAVLYSHRDIVDYLLQQQNVDIYAKDSLGFTPIHMSLACVPMAKLFLDRIANIREVVSKDGLSHLHVAAFVDNDIVIEKLVKNGANINALLCPSVKLDDSDFLDYYVNQTPLQIAVDGDNVKAAQKLIDKGADIHASNLPNMYDTPLQSAMRDAPNQMIQLFEKRLRRDKRFNKPIEACGVTLLHFACAFFDIKWAKKLLEKGADPNAQISKDGRYKCEWKGFTPLHVLLIRANFILADLKNLAGMVRLLLRHGADVTLQDELDYSPLHFAEKFAYESIPDGPHEVTDEGSEPSDEGVVTMFEIGDLLLKSQKSYTVNPATRQNMTHFHYACKRNKIDIVRKFLENGINVNDAKSVLWGIDAGFAPIHYALYNRHHDLAHLLLDYNANVHVKDYRGNTPLHMAVKYKIDNISFNSIAVWEKLSRMGADVKAKNFFEVTPMSILLQSDRIYCHELKFFFDRGCLPASKEVELDKIILESIISNEEQSDDGREEILKTLLKSCNVIKQIKNGFDALHIFVAITPNSQQSECDNWSIDMYVGGIQLIMGMGFDIDHQNNLGATALHTAGILCNANAVEALLLLGADINIMDNFNKTPFQIDYLLFVKGDRKWNRVIKAFSNHAWKMISIGTELKVYNELVAKCAFKDNLIGVNIEERCRAELTKMAEVKFSENWTMRDFLLSKATKDYQAMPLDQRQKIDEIFVDHADLRKKFPEYCGLLMFQYRKALASAKLYWSVKNAVTSLLKLKLPNNCVKTLLKYFDNDEITKLITVTKNIGSEKV